MYKITFSRDAGKSWKNGSCNYETYEDALDTIRTLVTGFIGVNDNIKTSTKLGMSFPTTDSPAEIAIIDDGQPYALIFGIISVIGL